MSKNPPFYPPLYPPLNRPSLPTPVQYDCEVCGIDRSAFVREVLQIDDYMKRVAFNQNDQVIGYCVVALSHSCDTGIVEPLYADNEKIAELLIAECCRALPDAKKNLIYPCWNVNHKSIDIAKKLGLQDTISVPILFTKRVVEGNMDKIFCTSDRCFFPF